MKLYLVRHAAAEDAPASTTSETARDLAVYALTTDARRALTPKGTRRFARGVAGLERLGVSFDEAWTSPLRRAVETTELLLPLVSPRDRASTSADARDGATRVCAELAERPNEILIDRLAHAGVDRLACVGHEPHLSSLALWLVTGWHASGDERHEVRNAGGFELAKGGVLVLEGEPRPGGMRLVASYPPSALRKLSRR